MRNRLRHFIAAMKHNLTPESTNIRFSHQPSFRLPALVTVERERIGKFIRIQRIGYFASISVETNFLDPAGFARVVINFY